MPAHDVVDLGGHEPELRGSAETDSRFRNQRCQVLKGGGWKQDYLTGYIKIRINTSSVIRAWCVLSKQALLCQAHDPSPTWLKTSGLIRKGWSSDLWGMDERVPG